MGKCTVRRVVLMPFTTNCYLITNEDTKETLIVDPSIEHEKIDAQIAAHGLKPVAILLTHGHFDHILLVPQFKAAHGDIPIYGGRDEVPMFTDASMNGSARVGFPAEFMPDIFLDDGEELELAGFKIRVIATPGHTEGGVCFYFPEEKILISGDTLFSWDFGRTDLPGGSMEVLVYSIIEKLFRLPDDVEVFPGHEESTDLGTEKKRNSILQFKYLL